MSPLVVPAYYRYQAACQQQRQLRLLLDTVSDGVALLDQRGCIRQANPRGYDELAALNGAPVKDRPGKLIEDLLAAQPDGFRQVATTVNLPVRAVEIVGRPLAGAGHSAGWVLTLRDVTPQTAAQESLAIINAHLHKAQRLARIGSFEFDFSTARITTSSDLSGILQLERDSYNLGFSFEEMLALVHPDDLMRLLNVMHAVIDSGEPFEPVEFRLRRLDGTTQYLLIEGELERAADGLPLRMVGMVQDITDRAQYAHRLEGLRTIDHAIREGFALEAIVRIALRHLCDILPCASSSLFILDAMQQQATLHRLDGVEAEHRLQAELFSADQWALLRQGKQQVFAAADQDTAAFWREFVPDPATVWLVIPMIDRDELIGLTAVGLPYSPQPEHALVSAEVANLLAVAIRQTQLDEMIFQQALHLEQIVIERTQELRRMTEEVEAILQNSSDTIILTDREGRVLRANAVFEEMFQRPLASVLGKPLTELFEDSAPFEAALRAALQARAVDRFEVAVQRGDGSALQLEIGLSAFEREVGGVVCNLRDATRRHRAEQSLRESERRFRLLAENMTDFVTLHDTSGNLVYASPSIERLLGYTTAEMAKLPQDIFFYPDDFQVLFGTALQLYQTEQTEARVEIRMRCHTGDYLLVECRLSLVRDEQGQVIRVMNVSRDITDRKRLEEHLRHARDELERRVAERTGELENLLCERERIQTQLIHSEKMTALGRLVGSIAHEINNPIQAVMGCLSLVQMERAGAQRPEKIERYLNIVQTETERIAAIVRRMREFYRPAVPGLQPVNIHDSLQAVLELCNKQLQHSHIEVACEWVDALPLAQANPDELKQVFLNLVLHAVDVMPNGGVLRLATGMGRLHNQAPAVALEFTNTGEGFSPELLPRVFEPFFAAGGGSGLGLSISYGVIAACGGTITVESDPDLGTTFTVLLPVAG